jgi:hypothetical protein
MFANLRFNFGKCFYGNIRLRNAVFACPRRGSGGNSDDVAAAQTRQDSDWRKSARTMVHAAREGFIPLCSDARCADGRSVDDEAAGVKLADRDTYQGYAVVISKVDERIVAAIHGLEQRLRLAGLGVI